MYNIVIIELIRLLSIPRIFQPEEVIFEIIFIRYSSHK